MKILEFNQKKNRLIIEENGKKKKYTAWHMWHTQDKKNVFFECNPYFLNIFSESDDHGFAPIWANIRVLKYLMGDTKNHPFKFSNKKTKVLVVLEDGTILFGEDAIEFFDSLVLAEKMAKGNMHNLV